MALLDQVLVNTPEGNFDSQPLDTKPCSASPCNLMTPFALVGTGPFLTTYIARNTIDEPGFRGDSIRIQDLLTH